jgi:hypothetical protein
MRFQNFRNQLNGRSAGIVFALAFVGACLLGWQWRAQAQVLTPGCPAITFTFNLLPVHTVGAPVNINFTAQGGVSPYKYKVTAGALPNNLQLALNGALTGTPAQIGDFYFTVTAFDAKGCSGSQKYKLTIKGCPTVTIQPGLLPSTQVNTPYNATLTASGHVAPYTFLLTVGALPAGMNLSSSGVLSGTPTQAGQFNFSVTAISATGCKGTRGYSIQIKPVLQPQASTP